MSLSPARKVAKKFTTRLAGSIEYHRELIIAVYLKRHQASLETMLAEQFVLNTAILWEVFLSDLLIAYLVMSPYRFLKNLQSRFLQSTKERFGSAVSNSVSIKFPKDLSPPRAKAFADPKDFNITFQSADQLSVRANELLLAKHAKRFTLSHEDRQFIDFIIALRNYLAHRSKSSREVLKRSTATLSGKNSSLRGSASNVGTYLKARVAGGDIRSILIAQRLKEIADALA